MMTTRTGRMKLRSSFNEQNSCGDSQEALVTISTDMVEVKKSSEVQSNDVYASYMAIFGRSNMLM